ncbi:DUF3793 family protein [Haloimpatiens sp. FM7330]|uniref:DUF3793 family protein n=1 Tax=Haloimpatiens sp. FM7330 TaxID=3298610 RepID=UPI00362742D1
MSENVLNDYLYNINKFQGLEYLMFIILHNVSPVVVGIKPSVLITFSNNNRELFNLWKKHKGYIIKKINLDFCEIKVEENSVVIMFYKKKNLESVLLDKRNSEFLENMGYEKCMELHEKINLLIDRYNNGCPHEIGIFLGYPVKDVIEFIKYPRKKCILCGYWKVYHNPEKAKKIFNEYDRVKNKVIRLFVNETNVDKILQKICAAA